MLTYATYIPRLTSLYNERRRTYHSLTHIQRLTELILTTEYTQYIDLARYDVNKQSNDDQEILLLSAWFHDAYYDAYLGSPKNEEISARIFASMVASDIAHNQDVNVSNSVSTTILLTRWHIEDLDYESYPQISMLFLDLDMYGFIDTDEFNRNSDEIRKEYYRTSDEDYNNGRINFLTKLLQRERIYYTLDDVAESLARANITKAIQQLTDNSNAK